MKLLLLVLPAVVLTGLAQETTLDLYPVHYADPNAIAPLIPMMVISTNGLQIQPVERRLAVRGTAEQHAAVQSILRELDQPPKNVQINVSFSTTGKRSSREAGIRPQGPVVIRDGEIHGTFEGHFSSRNSSSSEITTQMLVAMDGRSAMLRIGERVPYLAWLTEYASRHGIIRETTIEWRDVGSFLAVVPEIINNGPAIRVRLIPELSGRTKDGNEETIRFTELAAEVIVRDGETLSIGGFTQNEDFYSKFLVGRSGGNETSITDITLTPHILP